MNRPDVERLSAFYHQSRIREQQHFYDSRRQEYKEAAQQLYGITTGLLLAAAAAGVLGAADVPPGRVWWGLGAAAFSALAAIATAWGTLMGFEENALLYTAARVTLDPLRGPLEDHPGDAAALARTVTAVEEVLQAETALWGQQLRASTAAIRPAAEAGIRPGPGDEENPAGPASR